MNIRELREIMGLSVAQVADELGVPKQDVEDSEEMGTSWLLQPFISVFPINPAVMTDPEADPFLESYVQNEAMDRSKEWREENGITAEQMAEALNMTPEQLITIEKSGKIPRALGIKIEKIVGMNRKWLMYGDGRDKGICLLKTEKEKNKNRRHRSQSDDDNPAVRSAPNKEAGTRMKEVRKQAGLTREEVSSMLGVSVSRIAQMECGYIRNDKAEEVISLICSQPMGKDLGLQIREARKSAGMTLKDAADALGITPGMLTSTENGHVSAVRAKEMISVFHGLPRNMEPAETFSKEAGNRIREERKAAGLSQKALGVILRVPESSVARMELGNVTEERAKEVIRRIHGGPRHNSKDSVQHKVKKTAKVLLGRKIREAREAAGLSQKALGDLINCHQSRVSLMEKGQVDEAATAVILQTIAEEKNRREAGIQI